MEEDKKSIVKEVEESIELEEATEEEKTKKEEE